MSHDAIFFWKPRPVAEIRKGMTVKNVMTAGRDDVPEDKRIMPTITFTEWGIVYSHMSNTKRTHFAMIWKSRLWRGRSLGGTPAPKGMSYRARKFAAYVVKEAAELEGLAIPPSDAELLSQNTQLLITMRSLVDLIESWMRGALPKAGIHFPTVRHYPPALRKALKLIGRSWR